MMPRRHLERGFTLLEMLVAMALFSLVLASFGAAFFRLEKTRSSLARVEQSETVELVRRFLRRSLEAARSYSRPGRDGVRHVHFAGQRNRLAFVVVAAGEREVGGVYETELWLDDKGRLMVLRRPLDWAGAVAPAPDVLLENLATLTFAYAACPARGSMGGGAASWTRTDQLPFRIDITVEFRGGDRRVWQPMSVFIPAAACAGTP